MNGLNNAANPSQHIRCVRVERRTGTRDRVRCETLGDDDEQLTPERKTPPAFPASTTSTRTSRRPWQVGTDG
jgi:hypothetical protein